MKLVFRAVGAEVRYKNPFFLFGDDPVDEAPDEVLCRCRPLDGNYGEILSAEKVAEALAAQLSGLDEALRKAAGLS